MKQKPLSRRDFLRKSAVAGTALVTAACTPAPQATPKTSEQSDKTSSGKSTEVVKPAAAVKLSFWSEVFPDWVQSQIAKYKEVKPEVEFEFISFKWGEMTDKLLTATAGGTPPNCVIQDRFRMAGWASRGGVTPLDDYITRYRVNKDDYWPATWAESVWDGKVNAIPFDTDGRFVFWNKDLFKAAGLDPETPPPTDDWEGMIELAKKLTKSSGGMLDQLGLLPYSFQGLGNGGDVVIPWANGGNFLKDERTASMNDPKLVESLQWMLDVTNAVGGINNVSAFVSGLPATAGYSAFGAGKVAMVMDGDWQLANLAKFYPDLKFGASPWHVRNDKEKYTGFAGGFCLAIPKGAKEIEASYEWLNFISSYDAQLSLGIEVQRIPVLKKAALAQDLISKSPYPELRKLANESMEYANFRPVTPVGQLWQDLWGGPGRDDVLYGKKSAQDSCNDMQVKVQKALDEFWASK